jgi:tetratricopeptide (TPR) repeat protein
MAQTTVPQLIQQAAKLHAAGNLDQATRLYLQVLAYEPNNFVALSLSGAAALQSGDAATGETLIRQALTSGKHSGSSKDQQQRLGDAYNNLAIALQKQRKLEDALVAAREALKYRSKDADTQANTGQLLKELGHYEEAESMLRSAIATNPKHTRALMSLALILYITRRRAEAEQVINAALRLEPNHPSALSLKGNLQIARQLPQAALECFDKALTADPENGDARYNRALLNLSLGHLGTAWPDLYRYHPARRWTPSQDLPFLPERLDGKHVFINRNQGVGDELFFMRFVSLVKQRGARISYRTENRLCGFVARMGYIDTVVSDEVKKFSADHVVLVDQLPYLLQCGDRDVPPSISLDAKPEALTKMALRLQQAGPPPYLGVTWRAGRMRKEVNFKKEATEILFKEIAPEQLAVSLRSWQGTILILQRNPDGDEFARFEQALGHSVADFSDVNNDLEDMLALLSLIERYVTVSNTNLHLRAAARLPTHVLVPNPPEWRWGFSGRSRWFPDCPTFRQGPDDDWQAALTALSTDILR